MTVLIIIWSADSMSLSVSQQQRQHPQIQRKKTPKTYSDIKQIKNSKETFTTRFNWLTNQTKK